MGLVGTRQQGKLSYVPADDPGAGLGCFDDSAGAEDDGFHIGSVPNDGEHHLRIAGRIGMNPMRMDMVFP